MDLQCIKVIWYLKLFIILKLFVNSSNSVTLAALSRICSVEKGTLEINTVAPAKICTAVATYSTNKDSLDDMQSVRGNLPFVFIHNILSFKALRDKIKSKKIDEFVSEINQLIIDYKIDAFVIDNMNPTEIEEQDNHLQEDIRSLFSKLKQQNRNILFGLTLPSDINIISRAYSLPLLDPVVDFYLAKTYDYKECKHKNHQKDMAVTSPVGAMQATLAGLRNLDFNFKKVIFIVRIVVETINDGIARVRSESYAFHCESNPENSRKFCVDTLDNFYEKGRLVKTYNMPGVFIQSIDEDDHAGNCLCGYYPVLRTVDAGVNGLPKPDVVNCPTFGLLPRDRK